MRYRILGRTGLRVSEIGLGCASFWGKSSFDEATAVHLVHAAIDSGITFFDTGPAYSGGNAEPRLGRALAGHGGKHDLVIATKVGSRIDDNGKRIEDFSGTGVRKTVERSLERLRIEDIKLLQLHGPEIANLTDELMRTLEDLKSEGKIRHLGVNSFDESVIRHVMNMPQFDAIMIDYSVLSPDREQVINELAARNLGILAGMALGGSLYRNNLYSIRGFQDIWYLARAWKNHRAALRAGKRFSFMNSDADLSASQLALAWVLRRPEIGCAVFGTTRVAHLLENIKASDLQLSERQLQKLTDVRNDTQR